MVVAFKANGRLVSTRPAAVSFYQCPTRNSFAAPTSAVIKIEPAAPRGEPYQELLSPRNDHNLGPSPGAAPDRCSDPRGGILTIRPHSITSSPYAGPAVHTVLEARRLNSPDRDLDIVIRSSPQCPRSNAWNSTSTSSLLHSHMATHCTGTGEKLTSPG